MLKVILIALLARIGEQNQIQTRPTVPFMATTSDQQRLRILPSKMAARENISRKRTQNEPQQQKLRSLRSLEHSGVSDDRSCVGGDRDSSSVHLPREREHGLHTSEIVHSVSHTHVSALYEIVSSLHHAGTFHHHVGVCKLIWTQI